LHTKLASQSLKDRDHSEDLDADGKMLESILEKYVGKMWTEFMWFRIETSGGLL
jgi:hypothetical protein